MVKRGNTIKKMVVQTSFAGKRKKGIPLVDLTQNIGGSYLETPECLVVVKAHGYDDDEMNFL